MSSGKHTSFDDAINALKTLVESGYLAMFAGGCVRDRLLGVAPKDYDIATSATPEQSNEIFTKKGFRVVPSGVEHGTVTLITKSGPVEITTLRRDVETDGRHAKVAFENATFETDAARRDFTINSMFEDDTGKIHDYFGGIHDLNNHVLRFVGPPEERIKEDFLRILRFFRFWARLGFKPDSAAVDAISLQAAGLKKISQERITHELWEILSAQDGAAPAIESMINTGVMKIVLPETEGLNPANVLIFYDSAALPLIQRPWARLAVLLGLVQKRSWSKTQLQNLARKLRFSDRQGKLLIDLVIGWQGLAALDRNISDALQFASSIEKHGNDYHLTNFFAPIWSFLARHAHDMSCQEIVGWLVASDLTFGDRRRRELPLSGHDVSTIIPGIKGAQFGEVLTKLKLAYYNGEWRTRDEGISYLTSIHKTQ